MSPGNAERRPGQGGATSQAPHDENRGQRTAHRPVVTIRHNRFASIVTSPSAAVTDVLKAVVPRSGREYDPNRRVWIVYSTRVPALMAAFKRHRIPVDETGAAVTR